MRPHFSQAVSNICRVLTSKLGNFDGVPDDMVLANGLEPERLDANRAATNFGIPDKEPRSKGFAIDLGPTRWVDKKAEHILLTAVQSCSAVTAFLRRLEVRGKFLDNRKELRIPKPRVADSVYGAHRIVRSQQLNRLVRCGNRLTEHSTCRLMGNPVEGISANSRQTTHLGEGPVRHTELPFSEHERQITAWG